MLVCLGSGTTAAEAIADYGRFGVSILPATHLALASYASRPGASKYIERFVAAAPAAWTAAIVRSLENNGSLGGAISAAVGSRGRP